MMNVDCVLGNSSSGVIEAPLLKVPTLNLGDRQNGRVKFDTVIDSKIDKKKIEKSLELILSGTFRNRIKNFKEPIHATSPSKKIYNEIVNFDFHEKLIKNFYDLEKS